MGDAAQRWIVVGGGLAGLLAARRLARAGHTVTVYEAEAALGGRLSRLTVDGIELDAGAESFATRGGHVAKLIDELELSERIVRPLDQPAWVVRPGKAYPLPRAGWLGIPTKPFARDVRSVVGWRGAFRAWSDHLRRMRPVDDGDSLSDVLRARLGDAVTEAFVAPVVQGIYSRDMDHITLRNIAPDLATELSLSRSLLRVARRRRAQATAGSAVLGLDGGIATIVAALEADARAHGVEIVTGARVTGLAREGDVWRVGVPGGPFDADGVVLAVPRPVVATLMPAVGQVPSRQVALVTLVLDAPELEEAPRGTGVLAPDNGTGPKALTHATAKWEWLARVAHGWQVVRLSYAADNAPADANTAVGHASALLGVPLRESQVREWATRVWLDAAPAVVVEREPEPGLHLVGSAAGLSGIAAIVAADQASTLGE